jgi:hypothetical protein
MDHMELFSTVLWHLRDNVALSYLAHQLTELDKYVFFHVLLLGVHGDHFFFFIAQETNDLGGLRKLGARSEIAFLYKKNTTPLSNFSKGRKPYVTRGRERGNTRKKERRSRKEGREEERGRRKEERGSKRRRKRMKEKEDERKDPEDPSTLLS